MRLARDHQFSLSTTIYKFILGLSVKWCFTAIHSKMKKERGNLVLYRRVNTFLFESICIFIVQCPHSNTILCFNNPLFFVLFAHYPRRSIANFATIAKNNKNFSFGRKVVVYPETHGNSTIYVVSCVIPCVTEIVIYNEHVMPILCRWCQF